MDYFQAIVLAIIQGLTEFLPISSSAHLILFPAILGWQDQGLAFDVAVHVGTLLAVITFLRKEIAQIIPAWLSGWSGFGWNQHGLLGWWVILVTIPVGLVGLLGGDWIEQNLRSPWVIAWTTLTFGLLLAWADRKGNQNQTELNKLNWQHALYVGAAQAIALIPGTSRSGITMTALLAVGYSRIAAARFSFLMAVPAIALPGMLKTRELLTKSEPFAWDVLLIGVIVSALMAFCCMQLFMRFIERVGMKPFVIYRVILALALFLWVVM